MARASQVELAMNIEAMSLDQCLQEAAEGERLARLARSKAARTIMTLSAALWRKRAREAAEQTHPYSDEAGSSSDCPSARRDRRLKQSKVGTHAAVQ